MEPGHEDREYKSHAAKVQGVIVCLNGARS